jgi:hypothetical protein
MEFFDESTSKLSEEYEQRLINDSGNSLNKEHKTLSENGIDVGLHCEIEKDSWMVPVYHQVSDKLIFFGWSKDTTEVIEVMLIVNKNRIEKYEINPHSWVIREIDVFDSVESISIIIDGEIFNNVDFSKIDKEYYKLKNQIIYQ